MMENSSSWGMGLLYLRPTEELIAAHMAAPDARRNLLPCAAPIDSEWKPVTDRRRGCVQTRPAPAPPWPATECCTRIHRWAPSGKPANRKASAAPRRRWEHHA